MYRRYTLASGARSDEVILVIAAPRIRTMGEAADDELVSPSARTEPLPSLLSTIHHSDTFFTSTESTVH